MTKYVYILWCTDVDHNKFIHAVYLSQRKANTELEKLRDKSMEELRKGHSAATYHVEVKKVS